ncbi:MAG: 4Fe-4S binding protein [Desulfobacterales bacterium]|nr:4Fe-4S binding protein [Desulfobacterales bacterium]
MSYSITDECIGCGSCAKKCPESAIEGKIKVRFNIDPYLCVECGTCFDICPKGAILDPLGKPSVKKGKNKKILKATISTDICAGCRTCFMNCPQDAIKFIKKGIFTRSYCFVNSEDCVGCGTCSRCCITGAIELG